MSLGELFTLVVYSQLILENARIYRVQEDLVDQIFDFLVRDFSRFALDLYLKPGSSPQQMEYYRKLIRKPEADPERYHRVFEGQVLALKDLYTMAE